MTKKRQLSVRISIIVIFCILMPNAVVCQAAQTRCLPVAQITSIWFNGTQVEQEPHDRSVRQGIDRLPAYRKMPLCTGDEIFPTDVVIAVQLPQSDVVIYEKTRFIVPESDTISMTIGSVLAMLRGVLNIRVGNVKFGATHTEFQINVKNERQVGIVQLEDCLKIERRPSFFERLLSSVAWAVTLGHVTKKRWAQIGETCKGDQADLDQQQVVKRRPIPESLCIQLVDIGSSIISSSSISDSPAMPVLPKDKQTITALIRDVRRNYFCFSDDKTAAETLGDMLSDLGRTQEALRYYKAAGYSLSKLKNLSGFEITQRARASRLFKWNSAAELEDALRLAISKDSSYAMAYYELARVLESKAYTSSGPKPSISKPAPIIRESLRMYDEALDTNKWGLLRGRQRAVVLFDKGRTLLENVGLVLEDPVVTARECFEQSLREDPEFVFAQFGIVYTEIYPLLIKRKPGEKIVVESAFSTVQSIAAAQDALASSHIYLGYMWELRGQVDKAKDEYLEASIRDPLCGDGYYHAARIAAVEKRYGEACHYLQAYENVRHLGKKANCSKRGIRALGLEGDEPELGSACSATHP